MTYVILDLEFNGTYSKKRRCFVNEIIEFGAVKLDEQLNIIDTFSKLVSPQISKKLNSHVSALTHITYEELADAHSTFTHVLSKFKKFIADSALLTWGLSDILVLMENCRYYLGDEKVPALSSYMNLQRYCEDALDHHDRSRQLGLSTCAELIQLDYEETSLHRALADAELSSLCFKALYSEERFRSLCETVNDEFYRRLTFKNYSITDLKDPSVNKKEMFFLCDQCGRKAHRKSKWKMKNKSFRAHFRCSKCKRDFEGRIVFKMTFDGVIMDKRIYELPAEPKKQTTT